MKDTFNKRVLWMDVVRISAIYLVLLVHSDIVPVQKGLDVLLSTPIASASVPLFVMLSGALLLGKNENYKIFFKKRLLRLLLPWVTWSLIYTFFIFFQNPTGSVISLFKSSFLSFWFLPMIFGLYLLTPALRIFVGKARLKDIGFLILLWFLAVSILPFYRNTQAFPLFVDDGLLRQVVNFSGYFLAGYFLTRIKLPKIYFLFLIFIFGIFLSIFNFYFLSFKNMNLTSLSFNFIFPGVVILSFGLFGMIKSLGKRIDNFKENTKKIIVSLSKASFGIYFIHVLLMEIFQKITGKSFFIALPVGQDWVNALVLFIVSYFLIMALTKIPFAKKFIT